jgi:hypothetical protein
LEDWNTEDSSGRDSFPNVLPSPSITLKAPLNTDTVCCSDHSSSPPTSLSKIRNTIG